MCVMSSPSCVRAPVTAFAALTSAHTHPHTYPAPLLHQRTRYLIKKLHAPRRSHLIHTMEINPQTNAFEGRQGIAGALNTAHCSQLGVTLAGFHFGAK